MTRIAAMETCAAQLMKQDGRPAGLYG